MCQAHGRCHTRFSHMMTLPERGGVFHCRINAQMLSECPGGPLFCERHRGAVTFLFLSLELSKPW